MTRMCTVCAHQQTESISLELLQHVPMRDIAKRYNLSLSAVARHKAHIPAQLAVSNEAQKVAKADTVLERIAELNQRADDIYKQATAEDDHALALKALKELREVTSLYAKLTGELQTGAVHNTLILSPEWVSMRAVMLNALIPYPEARQALVAALGGFELVQR